jgi:hypothetical protein
MLGTMLFSAAVPVFDNVAARADEVVPVSVFGKLSAGLREAGGAVPVPMLIGVLVVGVNPLTDAIKL